MPESTVDFCWQEQCNITKWGPQGLRSEGALPRLFVSFLKIGVMFITANYIQGFKDALTDAPLFWVMRFLLIKRLKPINKKIEKNTSWRPVDPHATKSLFLLDFWWHFISCLPLRPTWWPWWTSGVWLPTFGWRAPFLHGRFTSGRRGPAPFLHGRFRSGCAGAGPWPALPLGFFRGAGGCGRLGGFLHRRRLPLWGLFRSLLGFWRSPRGRGALLGLGGAFTFP